MPVPSANGPQLHAAQKRPDQAIYRPYMPQPVPTPEGGPGSAAPPQQQQQQQQAQAPPPAMTGGPRGPVPKGSHGAPKQQQHHAQQQQKGPGAGMPNGYHSAAAEVPRGAPVRLPQQPQQRRAVPPPPQHPAAGPAAGASRPPGPASNPQQQCATLPPPTAVSVPDLALCWLLLDYCLRAGLRVFRCLRWLWGLLHRRAASPGPPGQRPLPAAPPAPQTHGAAAAAASRNLWAPSKAWVCQVSSALPIPGLHLDPSVVYPEQKSNRASVMARPMSTW